MRRKPLILLCMLFARALIAQEEMPVIVDPPRVSMTVFTNWQEIQLTYTIRWLDGYEPLFDEAKPENMSFGEFELDPIKGQKLIKINERKYKKENYADLVYYLRYIGEKKGDITIPEQEFRYTKEGAGKSIESLEVYEVKAPGITLRYDSVLTKDADDIMDRVDFGSFRGQKNLFKGLIVGIALIFSMVIFLLFRKPAIYAAKKTSETKAVSAGQTIDEQEERLAPKYARIFLGNKLVRLQMGLVDNPDDQKFHDAARKTICNELRRFFLLYVPDLAEGEFSCEDIRTKISRIPEKRKKELLIVLTNQLEYHENFLYHGKPESDLMNQIIATRKQVSDLDDRKIWLFNKRQAWQRLNKWIKGLLRRAK